jgi:conjugal transfer/entry exclusion protein
MTTYNQNHRWMHRIVFAVATIAMGAGALELVAGAMNCPDPDAMAVRRQVIAAQSERAYQIRSLEQGQVKMAASGPSTGN